MKRLDSRSVWIFFFSFLGKIFFIGLPFLVFPIALVSVKIIEEGGRSLFKADSWLLIGIVLAFGFFALLFMWAKLSYNFYFYELTDKGFRKESGVIYKKYVTIPYDRIQNVDIHRGILSRILGLSDLQVQTAGMSGIVGSEGRLPGLSREVAEMVRDELIERSRIKNQGGI